MSHIELRHGDCLELMRDIPDGSIDAIIADLPYGTTAADWDSIIPFEPLWAHYKRLIKPNGAIVLTASQPFTTRLNASNLEWFKYELIWAKTRPSGHAHAKNKPMKKHENISVFSPGTTVHQGQSATRMTYNPQGVAAKRTVRRRDPETASGTAFPLRASHKAETFSEYTNYPDSILTFANPNYQSNHPNEKPVALMEYLIRTYTNEGETVLDNTMGSGTTGVACVNTGRNFIGIELSDKYVDMARRRIRDAQPPLPMVTVHAYDEVV